MRYIVVFVKRFASGRGLAQTRGPRRLFVRPAMLFGTRVSLDAAAGIMSYSTHKVLSWRVNKLLLNERRDG